MTALVLALAAAVGLLALLVAGVLRSHAEILRVLHELGVEQDDLFGPGGQPVPGPALARRPGVAVTDVAGSTPAGGAVHVGVVGAPHPTLLAFLSTGCAACTPFWEGLGGRPLELPDPATRVVVVTKGPEAESPADVTALAHPDVKLVMSTAAFEEYRVPATPYFVLVDGPTGTVAGEGSAAGWAQLTGLARRAGRDRRARRRFADRQRDTDAELAAAGLEPGDPALRPRPRA